MMPDAEILPRPAAPDDQRAIASFLPFLLLGVLLAWLLGWYWRTAVSIEESWARSETFQHGYVILPISAWLIWRQRQRLTQIPIVPVFWPLILLVLLGFGWLLADLAQVVVIRQYALVLMGPVLVAIVMGIRFAWALAFPLAFLVFAVPFGDFLIPPMMRFTADFTMNALQLTGIPVYREGMNLSLPSGNWSVVEACSGLRYFIAAVTLGCLYAYLTYRSLKYRLIFIGLSVLMPILANGLRAYLIVMIGHLSNMQLAVGMDHLIYGWIFFGVVIMLLFWAGSFWREDTNPEPVQHVSMQSTAMPSRGRLILAALLSASVIIFWPIYAMQLDAALKEPVTHLTVPEVAGWKKTDQVLSTWQPHYLMPRARAQQIYEKDGHSVGLFIGYYNHQTESIKLISSLNALTVTEEKNWGTVDEHETEINYKNGPIIAHQALLRGSETRLLAWHWFWVRGEYTGNSYIAKFLQAKSRLFRHGDDSAVIILYTRSEDRVDSAATVLREFVLDAMPAIERSLDDAGRE